MSPHDRAEQQRPSSAAQSGVRRLGGVVLVLVAALISGCGQDPAPADLPAADVTGPPEGTVADAVRWDDALSSVGTVTEVCGPYAGGAQTEDGVFLNLGLDYPDPGRFTIVVWGAEWPDWPNGFVPTLCVTGEVSVYEGVPQMEVSPANVLMDDGSNLFVE